MEQKKTTSAADVLKGALKVIEFVNADNIAQGISVFSPEEVSFQTGRTMLQRIHNLAAKKCDFAFETTLASRIFRKLIKQTRIISNGSDQ